jgi:serine protease Do
MSLLFRLNIGLALIGSPFLLQALWSEKSTTQEAPSLKQTSRGFSHVARKAIPAVVSIKVETEVNLFHKHLPTDPFAGDVFKNFFNTPFAGLVPGLEPKIASSFGSGCLISSDGYITTNYHLIKNASKIEVTLTDETKHIAKLIGIDPDTDLAVIKIEGAKLPHLCFGNSDELEIGEWVIAIGSPQSLQSTLTVGVVSAKGRSDLELNTIEEFIQSDVAINPGNSGGPLLNVDSEIVGINSALLSPSGAYSGISFAIPSNIVKLVTDQLIQSGTVKRGFMGISLKAVTPEIAQAYNLEKTSGVVITDVVKNSSAEKAGLRFADVILEVDGQEIKGAKHLYRTLWLKGAGKKIILTINREGKTLKTPVILEEKMTVTPSNKNETFVFEIGIICLMFGFWTKGEIKSV